MVELQLEKLSPVPVTQIVWTSRFYRSSPAENLQTVIVVIVERSVVEEFLGRLETRGISCRPARSADARPTGGDDRDRGRGVDLSGAAERPERRAGGVVVRRRAAELELIVTCRRAGDRGKSLKEQLAQLVWAGELEGWLTTAPQWHLVADGGLAGEWENFLRAGLGEPVQVMKPLPRPELAAHTARRAAADDGNAVLLPAEFSARYQQQFVDRLWLHGLLCRACLYAIGVAVYFCATSFSRHIRPAKSRSRSRRWAAVTRTRCSWRRSITILSERQQLKYAALDCWKMVAEQLPPNLTLQRFSFDERTKTSLSGSTAEDQMDTHFRFLHGHAKAQDQRPVDV